jgi:hypothetical protein
MVPEVRGCQLLFRPVVSTREVLRNRYEIRGQEGFKAVREVRAKVRLVDDVESGPKTLNDWM